MNVSEDQGNDTIYGEITLTKHLILDRPRKEVLNVLDAELQALRQNLVRVIDRERADVAGR